MSQINNEVAAGQQHDYVTIEALKEYKITEGAKKLFGVPIEKEMTLLDLIKESVDVLSKLRLVYLFSLVEAFAEEYIVSRENIKIDDLKLHLKPLESAWKKKTTGLLISHSFLNWSYLEFVLKEKYKIDIDASISSCFFEAGPLRKCLVHDNGFISNEIYKQNLQNVIKIEGISNEIESQIKVTSKLVWVYIEDARKIIASCDF